MTAAPAVDVYARLDREALYADLRDRVFPAAGAAPSRIGTEVEVIPVEAESGRPLPLEGQRLSTLEILRRAGAPLGWRERRSAKANVPEIELPDGGRITFEPGGQIEISSAPNACVTGLVARIQRIQYAERSLDRPYWLSNDFADYRAVQGLLFPFRIDSSIDGRRTSTITVTAVTLNPPLSPAIWEKP